MMFDFEVVEEKEKKEYVIKKKDHDTFFWKFVADPQNPVRVTMDINDAKKFRSKNRAESFLDNNNLDKKGFTTASLNVN